jgi:RNA polymerase sigma-70 factor (ECF subfamily)
MTEQLILRWLNDGDERAAQALYLTHHEQVYRLAYALLGVLDDAEEVMQNTMVHALTRTNHYDPQRVSFRTWLHAITVSRCRDQMRRKNPGKVSLERATKSRAHTTGPSFGLESRAINHENHQGLWQALDQLNPNLREAIVLRYWCGHTYQEIAKITRCPLSTAQSRVRAAYEQLRKVLAPAGIPASGGENLR